MKYKNIHSAIHDLDHSFLSFMNYVDGTYIINELLSIKNVYDSETPEDKHLKALFGVIAEQLGQNLTRYHVFTSVKYLHWTGPVYFNVIRPFHHMVVWSMMKAGIKKRQVSKKNRNIEYRSPSLDR